jgi:hypothetical protein
MCARSVERPVGKVAKYPYVAASWPAQQITAARHAADRSTQQAAPENVTPIMLRTDSLGLSDTCRWVAPSNARGNKQWHRPAQSMTSPGAGGQLTGLDAALAMTSASLRAAP